MTQENPELDNDHVADPRTRTWGGYGLRSAHGGTVLVDIRRDAFGHVEEIALELDDGAGHDVWIGIDSLEQLGGIARAMQSHGPLAGPRSPRSTELFTGAHQQLVLQTRAQGTRLVALAATELDDDTVLVETSEPVLAVELEAPEVLQVIDILLRERV